MPDSRYTANTVLEQGDSEAEQMTVPGVVVCVPTSRARTGVRRTEAEIAAALPSDEQGLEAMMANSVEEVCQKHDVRIQGNYLDADGKPMTVNIAVRNERDFTIPGLVSRDAGLRALYLESCVCDTLASELERQGRGLLTADEKAAMAELAQQLESMTEEETER